MSSSLPDCRDGAALLELAQKIVAASPADETEVTVQRTEDAYVRFADSGPTQSADRSDLHIAVRARLAPQGGGPGFREARATSSSTAEADTARAVERAVALARVSPVTADAPGLAADSCGPQAIPPGVTAMLDQSAADRIAATTRLVRYALDGCAAESLAPAGLVQLTALGTALANSVGRGVFAARGRAAMALTASHAQGGSGWAEDIRGSLTDLAPAGAGPADGPADGISVVERALAKARQNREPQSIAAGEYTVVLEPAAVASLLLFASYCGFGAREVAEESSMLCGRIGERAFSPLISISDDAADRRHGGLPFDGEGNPRHRVALVEEGVLREPVTDALWAARLGRENTGHGIGQPDPHGPLPQNLILACGQASRADLLAGVKRGLLVTQFHYTNMIEPRDLTLTGMTRNGTFLIEDGEVCGPVKNLRFTDSLVRILANVSAVGDEAAACGALFDGELLTPALRVEGFRFTSTTDF
ncbi:MAG: hypothetical protein CMJ87_03145 [Planctomycetes bacterium]|nr:hypothetical protein [Planctomycetota bacterium]